MNTLSKIALVLTAVLAGALPASAKPIRLSIVDVAGDLTYTKEIWERYAKAHPEKIEAIEYQTTTAPLLPAKLMAQQAANRLDTDLVLSGFDAMAAGLDKGIWQPVAADLAKVAPGYEDKYLDAARPLHAMAKGFGVALLYTPSGPLVAYNPDQVKTPPTTLAELKSWVDAHPKRFFYARPANSGPGRTFLMALPYMLGDKNPADPAGGWDKTWAYLKDLDKGVEYYPPGTGPQIKEYGQGGRDLTITTVGWDIQMRTSHTVPAHFQVAVLKDAVWVADAHFMLVPKGLDAERKAVVLDMMAFALQPEQQALSFATGGFYPGPAVKGVTLANAPAATQAALKDFLRPDMDKTLSQAKVVSPLAPEAMVRAFTLWDAGVGAKAQGAH